MALEDKWAELSEEQKTKAIACKTPEEIVSLASEEGYEISDSELEAIAGGGGWDCMSDCSEQGTCDYHGNYLNS